MSRELYTYRRQNWEVRMAKLIVFKVDAEDELIFEVEDLSTGARRPAAGAVDIEQATSGLDQALAKVRPLAEAMLAQLQGLSRKPDEISVEFGIKVNAEAGVVIAKASTEGNCKVTLRWNARNA